jgi:hypothetical protein
MRIKHRYSINNDSVKLLEYLSSKNVRFHKGQILSSFEIFEDDENWEDIKTVMESENLHSLTNLEYSTREIKTARWLRIRSSWRWGYPQPENKYQEITYNDTNYCSECGRGLIQKDTFFIKKEPNWGKHDFLQLFWIEDELFIKDDTAKVLQEAQLQGYELLGVRQYRTNELLKTTKQIKILNEYSDELVFSDNEINKKIICPRCGKIKYVLYGSAVIKAKQTALEECHSDILKTKNVFGDGALAAKCILISNNFAKVILENSWNDIVLEPIQLI